jgi:hypothetical protein
VCGSCKIAAIEQKVQVCDATNETLEDTAGDKGLVMFKIVSATILVFKKKAVK